MKKQVAILLLFCYSAALIRPLVPSISDLLAHTFWKNEHMATVHFENGKYHVHLETQKANKQDHQNDSQKTTEENVFVHLNAFTETIYPPPGFTLLPVEAQLQLPSPVFLFVNSPPPWQC